MTYLISILVPLALLALFLLLVTYEERRGARVVLPGPRQALDLKVARAAFIVRHVDWGAFTNDVLRSGTERILHDLAHTSLIIVRALERALTRLVRTLRARRDMPLFPAREEERPSRLESAAQYLRKSLNRSRSQPTLPAPEDDRA